MFNEVGGEGLEAFSGSEKGGVKRFMTRLAERNKVGRGVVCAVPVGMVNVVLRSLTPSAIRSCSACRVIDTSPGGRRNIFNPLRGRLVRSVTRECAKPTRLGGLTGKRAAAGFAGQGLGSCQTRSDGRDATSGAAERGPASPIGGPRDRIRVMAMSAHFFYSSFLKLAAAFNRAKLFLLRTFECVPAGGASEYNHSTRVTL